MRDELYYREKLAAAHIPEHMHDGYVLYLLHGIPPGSFLTAVLTNDLREACGRADEVNRAALYQHVFFLYNYAPRNALGSLENVREWMQQHSSEVAS